MSTNQVTHSTISPTWSQGTTGVSEQQTGQMVTGSHSISSGPTGPLSTIRETSLESEKMKVDSAKTGPIDNHVNIPAKKELGSKSTLVRTDEKGTKTLDTNLAARQTSRIAGQLDAKLFTSLGNPGSSLETTMRREFEYLTLDEGFSKEQAISVLKDAIHMIADESPKLPSWAENLLSKVDTLGGEEVPPEPKKVDSNLAPKVDRVGQGVLDKVSLPKTEGARTEKTSNKFINAMKAFGRGVAKIASKISQAVSKRFEGTTQRAPQESSQQKTQRENRELIEQQGFKWEIDDVCGNPKLFAAMEKFAQSKFQGEMFVFIGGVKDLQKLDNPEAFKQGLEQLYNKSILGNEDNKEKGIAHQINIYPEHQKEIEKLKNGPINSENLAEVKSKLDSLMKEVVGAESMWSREIVGNFRLAHPKPLPQTQPTAPKKSVETPKKVKTDSKISKTTQTQIDVIKNSKDQTEIDEAINKIINSIPKKLQGAERNKAIAKELKNVLSQLQPIKDFPLANKTVSLKLGQTILSPNNSNSGITKGNVMSYITLKGIEQPGKCGADLWRTMNRIQVSKDGEQLVDGSKISKDKDLKDVQHSQEMVKVLNSFYQKATGTKEPLLTDEDIGIQTVEGKLTVDGQGGATRLGEILDLKLISKAISGKPESAAKQQILANIEEIQKKMAAVKILTPKSDQESKEARTKLEGEIDTLRGAIKGKEGGEGLIHQVLTEPERKQIKTMQKLFGLGAQELFTRPGDWAIPENFRKGEGGLSVAEFSGGYVEQMKPFQYGREIEIKVEGDQVKYIVRQPMTFKDTETSQPIGLCRMETILTFDKDMECQGMQQQVLSAQ